MICFRVIVRPMQSFRYIDEWEEDVAAESIKDATAKLQHKYPNEGMLRYSFEFPNVPKKDPIIRITKKKKK